MDWFSSSGLAGFAKSALKGAQKTIDKALDIRDEEEEEDEEEKKTSIEEEEGEFFGKKTETDDKTEVTMVGSSWGSFNGSYFTAAPKPRDEDGLISSQPQKLSLSLSSQDEGVLGTLAPLATPETELTPVDTTSGFPSKYTQVDGKTAAVDHTETDAVGEEQLQFNSTNATEEKVIVRPKARRNSSNRNSYVSNRLSVISCDSEGKRSSDSVEVIGGGSVSCATSPDTDMPSISTSSSMGLPISSSYTDSVEVIDSLASPSSVEVIAESSSSSGGTTHSPPVHVSTWSDIPVLKSSLVLSSPDVSPDSVEVIELDEETSIADSYTSASESTGATILEPPYAYASINDLSQASSKLLSGESTPDMIMRFSGSSKRHGSCDLLSESIHEVHDDMDPQDLYEHKFSAIECTTDSHSRKSRSMHGSPTRRLASKSEERTSGRIRPQPRVEGPARKEMCLSESEGSSSFSSQTSQTLTGNDSEGTLMGSSDDGNTTSAAKAGEAQTTTRSIYVKEMLAEAMGEDSVTRETSPTLSEKSRSDLVKVGSEQTSGHTSGDELETTTSSDIEIISNRCSPNGDSSSTTSRQSPAKLGKYKLSLVANDTLSGVTHMKTKGHQREPSEASSWCSEDTSEVERLNRRVVELKEILDAREAKIIELLRDHQNLQEAAKKLGENTDDEKDKMIEELKYEGGVLSKKTHMQLERIKQLRNEEKKKDTTITSNQKKIKELTQEVEELKAKVTEKEKAESEKGVDVDNLRKKITRQDDEIIRLMNQLEETVVKAERMAEKLRVADSKVDVQHRDAAVEQARLQGELEKLRKMQAKKETSAKEEVSSLMKRLEEAERRNEELAQSVSGASRPLLRQLEALQAATCHERESWEKQERDLEEKLQEAKGHLKSVQQNERALKQETLDLWNKVASLELSLEATKQETSGRQQEVSALQAKLDSVLHLQQSEKASLERQLERTREELTEARRDVTAAEQQLSVERAATDAERRRSGQLLEQLKDRDREVNTSPQSSPTLSFGRVSLSESVSSNAWPQFNEDAFEVGSVPGRYYNVYESLRTGNTTSVMEGLQAQLKLRDGEVSHLQWELQRREAERLALTTELSAVTGRVEDLETRLAQAETAERTLVELQRNYDALLQMYGEKVEEVDELRLDLEDVKEMYKTQIEQLLRREKAEEPAS